MHRGLSLFSCALKLSFAYVDINCTLRVDESFRFHLHNHEGLTHDLVSGTRRLNQWTMDVQS